MQRVIPITINIKTGTTDSQIMMYRGDSVKFQFNFTDTSSVSLDTATKLRVLVKPANDLKASYVWFSGEATITSEDYSIEFTSEQTSGYAGNGFLAVLVLDANNETVCTAGIPFRVEPSGYDGIYTPSEDFRDEVYAARDAAIAAKNEAVSAASSAQESLSAGQNLYQQGLQEGNAILADCNFAKTAAESSAQSAEASAGIAAQQASDAESAKDAAVAAKNTANSAAGLASDSATNAAQSAQQAQQAAAQAVEITDPEGWRTDTRAMIARLALTKSDSGTLYCNGGMAKTNSAGFTTLTKATILVRFARTNTTHPDKEYICNIGDGETVNTGISVVLLADNRISIPLYLKKPDGTKFGTYISAFDASEYLDGKMHSLAVCFAGTSAKAYVDGVLKGSASNIPSDTTIVASNINITLAGRGATNAQFFYGQVSDFAVLNYDASEVDSNGNYTSAYSIADYQAGKRLPPWSTPLIFGNGVSASVNTSNALCAWDGANWSMTQITNDATYKAMLYYIPLNVGQKLRIKFSNLTGGVLVDGKYGFFQPVRQEVDQINVSTTSLDAEFTAKKPIGLWRFRFNCEAVSDTASRVPTVFENFVVERDGATTALENYTIARNATTKLIKDASGNGNDATVSGNVAGDMDTGIAAFVDELKTQISQNS